MEKTDENITDTESSEPTDIGPVPLSLPPPPPPVNARFFRVERGGRHYGPLSAGVAMYNCLQLDGDVYDVTRGIFPQGAELPTGTVSDDTKPVLANGHRFLTNANFRDANHLNRYLRYWGKIPEFLEVRTTATKGYGVFTTREIPENTFIGFYQGNYRTVDSSIDPGNPYLFTARDFAGNSIASVDAENITFSNWARFVNDGKEPNIAPNVYNYAVYYFSGAKPIPAGAELLAPYGDAYWAHMKTRGIERVD